MSISVDVLLLRLSPLHLNYTPLGGGRGGATTQTVTCKLGACAVWLYICISDNSSPVSNAIYMYIPSYRVVTFLALGWLKKLSLSLLL